MHICTRPQIEPTSTKQPERSSINLNPYSSLAANPQRLGTEDTFTLRSQHHRKEKNRTTCYGSVSIGPSSLVSRQNFLVSFSHLVTLHALHLSASTSSDSLKEAPVTWLPAPFLVYKTFFFPLFFFHLLIRTPHICLRAHTSPPISLPHLNKRNDTSASLASTTPRRQS